MPSVEHLIGPFFTWKKASGKGFDEASKLKFEPHLLALAAWAEDEDVSEISTQLLEFDVRPLWHTEFFKRKERDAAQNTVRLVHNALASFFDYCWRRGLVPMGWSCAEASPGGDSICEWQRCAIQTGYGTGASPRAGARRTHLFDTTGRRRAPHRGRLYRAAAESRRSTVAVWTRVPELCLLSRPVYLTNATGPSF
jgi:hypothetical protein